MKDLIESKIKAAIEKLRNAKMWLRDGDAERTEENILEASDHIDSVLNDIDIWEQSLPPKTSDK